MICERESIMTVKDLDEQKKGYFPTHILVRKPKTLNSENSEGDDTFSVVNEVNDHTQVLFTEMIKTFRANNNDN